MVASNSRTDGSRFRAVRAGATARLACACLLFLLVGPVGPVAQAAGPDTPPATTPSPWLDVVMSDADRRHLLARTGIGVAPAHFRALEGMTRREGVDRVIAGLAREPSTPMPAWTRATLPMRHGQADASSEQKQRFRHERDVEFASLRAWWGSELLRTDSPQTERLVLLWHDLVPSDYRNTGRAPAMLARQNALFRRSHDGTWQDLLEALLRDGALLGYLDASSNRRDAPNENLGREFLERFTLGEGHYQEQDVREAARALTGLGIARYRNGAFQLRTGRQDRDQKSLFGQSGDFDADDLVSLTLAQPAAARHLVRVYWSAFVSDKPPDARTTEALARAFRQSEHDLGVLYRTMLHSEPFWADEHRATLVKSPIDMVSGLMRTLEYPKHHWQSANALQDSMGMALFEPPNVAGWDEGDAFVSVGRLVARQKGVRTLLSSPANGDRATDAGGMAMAGGTAQPVMMTSEPAMSDSPMAPAAGATLHVASEAYRGNVRTRVLLQRGTTTLWDSGPIELTAGRDTERLGLIDERSDLSWQQIALEAPPGAVADADTVRVLFLNDAAGGQGDRNLYIDRITLGNRMLLAIDGVQHSMCVPESALAAGNLYCAGQLTLSQPTGSAAKASAGADTTPAPSSSAVASAVHLISLSEYEDGRITADLVLDNLTLGERHRPVAGFKLVSWPDRGPQLRINSFHCSDGCLDAWPTCAWRDPNFAPMRSISAPLPRAVRAQDACLARLERPVDRALLDLLADNATVLLTGLLDTDRERVEQHRDGLLRLLGRIEGSSAGTVASAADSSAVRTAIRLHIDPGVAPLYRPPASIEPVVPQLGSADELQQALASVDIDAATLLWPGVAIERLPGNSDQPLERRLRAIAQHPAFQLR